MRIALDAMGGDNAPHTIVHGTVLAARRRDNRSQFLLVGQEEPVRRALRRYEAHYRVSGLPIEIVDAPEVIGMDEPPSLALRRKKKCSLLVAMRLEREGKSDGVISAGNTGAFMAAALVALGRLRGVWRPAIATFVPTEIGPGIMLDVGANVDSKPENLLQFATMGSIYAQYILDRASPRVGLLSVGEEKSKGDALTRATHELLSRSTLNFLGNVEGRDILKGKVDVVVCDGFVGNVVLKFAESIVALLYSSIKESIERDLRAKLGALFLKPALKDFARKMSYEEYGGAPLLGINGDCVVCHGRSTAKAISSAIKVAERFVQQRVNQHIQEQLHNHGMHLAPGRKKSTVAPPV
jgi:glycerol-3-phosphate acyltransferase PlsX